ncbi:MAG: FAD-dependent oxidoreductase [Firmicutes bacterium]|nr:FAD-dependent oxidoreductase [Bacillota bacterium]
MKKYPNLSKPLTIRGVTYRNRIFSTPTGLTYPDEYSGQPDFRTVLFYEKKARGGVSSVNYGETPVNNVDAVRRPNVDVIRPDFSRFILPAKDWIKLTDAISRHGANSCVQLCHAGLFAMPFFNSASNGVVVGPMDMDKEMGVHVKAMDKEDMDRITNDFAEAALCAVQSGFNQVMVQCCHGWLLAQFLSPHWNKRNDEFGGSIENRAKFPLQVLKAVREKVGPNIVIQIRISGDEHQKDGDGWSIEECIAFCKMAEEYVDIIEISSGDYHNSEHYCWNNPLMGRFTNIPIARELKKAGIKAYLTAVGSHNDPKLMDELIAEGAIDFFSIGRGILADPDLPKKWLTGKEEDVKPCIRCSDCMAGLYTGFYRCNINPTAGQEAYLLNTSSPKSSKDVVIVGGGVGGMEAAITACDRGHNVTLVEKNDQLGGTLLFADHGHKQELKDLKDYYVRQVEKRNIKVMLNTEANSALLDSLNPSDIIVASGSTPRIPNIPGIENARYGTAAYFNPETIGQKVILIGAGLINCEIAVSLLKEGKEVYLVELTDTIARDANMFIKPTLNDIFANYPDLLHIVLKASTKEVLENGIVYTDENGVDVMIEADTVLYAIGSVPNSAIVEEIQDWPNWESFRAIGDCTGASIVKKAIHQGYFAALDIL